MILAHFSNDPDFTPVDSPHQEMGDERGCWFYQLHEENDLEDEIEYLQKAWGPGRTGSLWEAPEGFERFVEQTFDPYEVGGNPYEVVEMFVPAAELGQLRKF